jgi:PKD repeat protein
MKKTIIFPKKTIIFPLLILFSLIIISAPAIATTVENGGFESGSISPWVPNKYPSTYVDAAISTDDKHSGTYSLKFTLNGGTRESIILSSIDLTGHTTFSFWAKGNVEMSTSGYVYFWYSSTWNQVTTSPTPHIDSTWREFTYTIPVAARGSTQLLIDTGGGSGATAIYIDDLEVDGEAYNPLPTAAYSGTPVSGSAPLQVSFTDASTAATSWLWDFGDGVTSAAQNPVHTYNISGVYNVSLKATNSNGYDYENKTAYITVNEQTGAFNNYFELTGSYSFDNGWPTVSFLAELTEDDPYNQYDQIIWYIDNSRISDADIAGSWVQYVELKNNSGWKYYNPATYAWTATSTYLKNKYHFHTVGEHTIRAIVLYQNMTVADVSLVVNANQLGLYSEKIVTVRNSQGALIPGATIGVYDRATGDIQNWTLGSPTPGMKSNAVLITGHTYNFIVAASGYTSLNIDRQWAGGGQFDPFVLYNNSIVPGDASNVYAHISIRTNADANGLPNPVPYALIDISSPSITVTYSVDGNGLRDIELAKNTYYQYTAHLLGYESVSGTFTTGTTNIDVPVIMAYIAPTAVPANTPTAVPTTHSGTQYPGYPKYTPTERANIVNGGIDQWVSALPGLVDLIILVCIMTLLGMMTTGITGKRRR